MTNADKPIDDIYQYIEEINKLVDISNNGSLIFRGQGDYGKEVESGAVRRLKKSKIKCTPKQLREYHSILIDNALKRRESHSVIKDKNEFTVLAELQHYGAATILLDFTFNSLVALFFACKSSATKSKVYCLKVDAPRFSKINSIRRINKEIKDSGVFDKLEGIFSEDDGFDELIEHLIAKENEMSKKHFLQWVPPHNNNRIIKQDSIFVISSDGKIEEKEFDKIIEIDKNCRENVLKELEHKFNITDESLYPDFYGYALANSSMTQYKYKDKVNFYKLGNESFSKGNFDKAIGYFTEEINIKPDNYFAYYMRGMSYYYKKDYENAIEDFNFTLKSNTKDDASIYFYRAYSYSQIGKHRDAENDYTLAINKEPNFLIAYNNRGYNRIILKNFEEAGQDLNKALELEPKYSLAKLNLCLLYILIDKNPIALNLINETIKEIIEVNDFVSAFALRCVIEKLLRKDNFSSYIQLKTSLIKLKLDRKKPNFNPDEMKRLIRDAKYISQVDQAYIRDLLDEIKNLSLID
ncbi:MAG: FRG domain-containing protein [Ignavibacteria bacterium]|nr:FRG domain-containing protein [Ignavibacteria bacterium]